MGKTKFRELVGKINGYRLLAYLTVGIMGAVIVAAIGVGKGINFRCFFGIERIYDFPEEELKLSSDTWLYEEDNEQFRLLKDVSTHKFQITKKVEAWKCLCLIIDKMSVETTEGIIVYYDKEGQIITEQPIGLTQGANTVVLYDNVEMYRIGIRVKGLAGGTISISSMQLRSELYAFNWGRFCRYFFLALIVEIILGFSVKYIYENRNLVKKNKKIKITGEIFITAVDQISSVGSLAIKKIKEEKRIIVRRTLFSVLFFWSIWGSFMEIAESAEFYRYYALICVLLLVGIAFFCREIKTREVKWSTPVAKVWIILWLIVVFSDIVVGEGIKFIGYIMLFAGGMFIFCWNQMENLEKVIYEAVEALEINFFLVIIICMFFRQKRMTAYYNGIFHNPQDFAVYMLLMYAVFQTELYWTVQRKKITKGIFAYAIGIVVALFLAIRAGGIVSGVFALMESIVWGYLMGRELWKERQFVRKVLQSERKKLMIAALAAVGVVVVVHISIKYLPNILGTNIVFKNEVLISNFTSEELELYRNAFPEEFENIVSWEELEIGVYQKNYARMLGLTGNIEPIKVYRENVDAYSGYLAAAYRYGVAILIPLILFQIYAVIESVKKKNIFLLFVNMIYIFYCMIGGSGIGIVHPLFWCVFLLNGYFFCIPNNKNLFYYLES